MFKEQLIMALDSLRANKFRSLLTMLGIIIGAGTLVAVLSLGNALQSSVFEQFIDLGTRRVAISPGDPQARGARDVPGYGLITQRDFEALSEVVAARPDLFATIAPLITVSGDVRAGTVTAGTTLIGTTEQFPNIQSATTAYGRFLSADDVAEAARVVVLGGELAVALFGESEAELQAALGQTVEFGGQPLEVIGILGGSASIFGTEGQIFVPASTVRLRVVGGLDLPGRGTNLGTILIGLRSEENVEAVEEVLRTALREIRAVPEGAIDDFDLVVPTQPLEILAGINGAVTGFIALVAGISLVVGGIGIMNIMLVAVTERTREIGVRKALGASDGDVLGQFVLEALAISLVGSTIGIVGAIGLVSLIGALAGISAPISVVGVILSLIFASLIGIGFGYYPARRAARLLPIEALRYE